MSTTEPRERTDPETRITEERIRTSKVQLFNILKDRDPKALNMLLEQIPDAKLLKLLNDKEFLLLAFDNEQEVESFRRQGFEEMIRSYGRTVDPRFYRTFTRLITTNPIKRLAWRDKAKQYTGELTINVIDSFKKAIERSPNGRQH
jgi:hypothetical protein